MAASPVVLFTGDMLGHNIAGDVLRGILQRVVLPEVRSPAAVAAMQQFIDKTMAFVAQQIRLSAGNAPVMYVVGNIDAYAGKRRTG